MVSETQQVPVQTHPPVIYQSCCGNFAKILPENYRKPCFVMGIILLIAGCVSLITGIVGFFTTSFYSYQYNHGFYQYVYRSNQTVHIGANIWVGIFYILAGIFAVTSYKNQANPHLINSYFGFSIISFILSIPHLSISIGYMVSQRYDILNSSSIWFNVVSIIISVLGFLLSLISIILLGNGIYCKATADTNVTTVHYQSGPGQVIAFQQYPSPQYPNQPVMAFQPAPVYVQAPQTGQPVLNTNQTEIGAAGKTQLPPLYAKLPNVGREEKINPIE